MRRKRHTIPLFSLCIRSAWGYAAQAPHQLVFLFCLPLRQGSMRRKRHTIPLFSSCIRSAWVREPSCGSLTTLHAWGSAPRPRLGDGPRLGYLFPASLRSGRKQIEPRGKNTVQGMNDGRLPITCHTKMQSHTK